MWLARMLEQDNSMIINKKSPLISGLFLLIKVKKLTFN